MAADPAESLTEVEADFAVKLAELIEGMSTIQAQAAAVRESGGDCKRAFLSVLPEEARRDAEMQWPYIQMMLGV